MAPFYVSIERLGLLVHPCSNPAALKSTIDGLHVRAPVCATTHRWFGFHIRKNHCKENPERKSSDITAVCCSSLAYSSCVDSIRSPVRRLLILLRYADPKTNRPTKNAGCHHRAHSHPCGSVGCSTGILHVQEHTGQSCNISLILWLGYRGLVSTILHLFRSYSYSYDAAVAATAAPQFASVHIRMVRSSLASLSSLSSPPLHRCRVTLFSTGGVVAVAIRATEGSPATVVRPENQHSVRAEMFKPSV